MSGPLPKNPAVRQRANRVAGAATLPAESGKKRRVPPLPKIVIDDAQGKLPLDGVDQPDGKRVYVWHPMTRSWWRDVWRSPMAGEYLQADMHGLYRLAVLIDRFWREGGTGLAAEIRLQQQSFGLTPIDRRRLQWEVERTEAVTQRKHVVGAPLASEPIDDPRSILRVVGGAA